MNGDADPDFGERYWRSAPAVVGLDAELTPDSVDLPIFRMLADALPTLCWVANGDGYIVWYNCRWHEYCGTTPEQMEGWGWTAVHDPEVLPSVMERWTACVAAGEPFEMTFPLRGADGRFRPFLTRVQPVRSDSGRVARWFGVNTDVSQQAHAEGALTLERSRSRDVLENMGDGFVLVDREFTIVEINAEGLRIDGRPRADLIGRHMLEVWPESEQLPIWPAFQRAMTCQEPVTVEYRHFSDMHDVWLESRAYPSSRGLAIFYRDISERKAAEERLLESHQRFRAAVDAVQGVVWTNNAQGEMQGEQPGWGALTGQSFEEYQRFGWAGAVHPDDAQPTIEAWNAAVAARQPFLFEHRVCRYDGEWRLFSIRAIPAMNASGSIREWVGVHTDITEQRQAENRLRDFNQELEVRVAQAIAEREQVEEALRQAQKMEAVGQLTGGIAHDFNNMLAVVIGSLDLLGRRISIEDARARRYVDAALEGARRAALLTQRLLAFSRQQPLRPEAVDANKLVAGMSDLLRHSLGAHIRLETVLAGGLWRTHADPNQLDNAILNLAVNAKDAMPEGGWLTIETQNTYLDARYAAAHLGVLAGQYVLIAVTDTGSGMPPEVIAKAFDPFFTTKEIGKGTGLGLSQVYGFVKQTGGHVKVYSEAGQGTTVKIYLPRLVGEGAVVLADDDAHALALGDLRELVLVVEDEDAVRQVSVDALEELGYRVLEADGAAAALRLLEAHPDIALLFTDVIMPDVNGRKLAEEAVQRRPDLKVLFTTGYSRNAVVHNGVLDPGVELIGKPFTLEELASKVRDVLDFGTMLNRTL